MKRWKCDPSIDSHYLNTWRSRKRKAGANRNDPSWEPLYIKHRWTKRCGNRCRKRIEIQRTMMKKHTRFSIDFGIASHESSSFWKKVHVRGSYEFLSRIRVAEGFTKNKEIPKIWNCIRKSSKNRSRKRKVHWEKHLPKKNTKTKKHRSQNRSRKLM